MPEVGSRSVAAPNTLTVDVIKTPQHCSRKLNKHHNLKTPIYVNASLPNKKPTIATKVKHQHTSCQYGDKPRICVKSQLKDHEIMGMVFTVMFCHFLNFLTYIVDFSKRFISFFSKFGKYATLLIDFFSLVLFLLH